MGLRAVESTLPPGFRFYPSDEELVCHYLYRKVANVKNYDGTMVEVDLHTREPWELPDVAKLSDDEWYFFSFRDRKYSTGLRTNRATKSGYWKATGKDRTINHPKTRRIVGMRKTLVFYSGRAPNGIKTAWVMHEFRLESPHTPPKEDWVLCRVFHKRKAEMASSSCSIEKLESSPRLVDPPSTMPRGSCSDNTMGSLHYSFIDFPQELGSMDMMGMGMGMEMGMGSKDGGVVDDYGFILDVGLDGMGANGIAGADDIRF